MNAIIINYVNSLVFHMFRIKISDEYLFHYPGYSPNSKENTDFFYS